MITNELFEAMTPLRKKNTRTGAPRTNKPNFTVYKTVHAGARLEFKGVLSLTTGFVLENELQEKIKQGDLYANIFVGNGQIGLRLKQISIGDNSEVDYKITKFTASAGARISFDVTQFTEEHFRSFKGSLEPIKIDNEHFLLKFPNS
jgi:hypothetical protein